MQFKFSLNFRFFILCLYMVKSTCADPLINQIETENLERWRQSEMHRNNDSSCGGIFEAVDTPYLLSYKMKKPKDRYESCVWTLYATQREKIAINVTNPLYYSKEDFIAVGYFSNVAYDNIKNFEWTDTSLTSQYLEIPGPVVFIHYFSEYDHPVFGFQLTYQAGKSKSNRTNVYKNYFLEGEYGMFNYFKELIQYNNYHRITAVLKAHPGTAVQERKDPSYLHVMSKGIKNSTSCSEDNVNLYGYSGEQKKWIKNLILCGEQWATPSLNTYPENHPVIITFKSSPSTQSNGFELRWMNQYY